MRQTACGLGLGFTYVCSVVIMWWQCVRLMLLVVVTAELIKPLGHSLKLPLNQPGQALLVLSKAGKQIQTNK